MELASRKVLWNVDGFGSGTVTLAGDTLLMLREDGELVAAPADPAAFKPSARAQVLGRHDQVYPALSDGVLFARDEKTLVAVRLK